MTLMRDSKLQFASFGRKQAFVSMAPDAGKFDGKVSRVHNLKTGQKIKFSGTSLGHFM